MTALSELLDVLSMPSWLLKAAESEVKPPKYSFDQPINYIYGFPPCVIPIWSDVSGPDYFGILHHWFGNRQTTFVRLHIPTREILEIGRTPGQFRDAIVFSLLCNIEETDEVAAFASELGVCEANRIEDYFEVCESDEDLLHTTQFRDNPPWSLAKSTSHLYRGDLDKPKPQFPFSPYEFSSRAYVDRKLGLPQWFEECSKPQLFLEFIEKEDFTAAWFTLNSFGWEYSETLKAIELLVERSGKVDLILLRNFLENVPLETEY